jgi:hypothetical protein
MCSRCVEEKGGCLGVVGDKDGKIRGEVDKHVLEWVPHPFLIRAWRKWEIDEGEGQVGMGSVSVSDECVEEVVD